MFEMTITNFLVLTIQVLKNCNLTIEAGKAYLGFQRYCNNYLDYSLADF